MADPIEKTPIPDTPPAEAKATQGAMRGIAAIKKACVSRGLDSKYAQCAILGIIGVESVWLPVQEQHSYKKATLMKTARVSDADAEKYGSNAGGAGMSKKEFFGWFYGTRNGLTPAEGQYYGRGFIQLTLKDNYVALGKLVGKDLASNPEIMVGTDDATMELCANIAVEFIKMRIKSWKTLQYEPGFIFTALHAVNPKDPSSSDHYKKKVRYYEYFLGGVASDPPTNKDAANTTLNKTAKEIEMAPPSKREAYTEDRTANFNSDGFTDPEGKYPLRDFMNEPDTNRLARGIIEGTNIKYKDTTRKTKIPIANTIGTYDQPQSAYNTVYPYNKVFESESGHVLEFDDSPSGERVNLYHQKGTFIEIDPNGSQINYIVGDGYYITERNGNIFINGTCNVTCSGPMNILCQGDANLEVKGQVDAVFHNNVNIGVAKDLNIAVGGDYNVLVEGNYNVEVGKTSNTRSIGSMSIESTDILKLKTLKTISMEGGDTASTAETLMKMSSSFKLETPADFQIKAKTFTLDVETATKIKTNTFQLDSKISTNILTGIFNTTTTMGMLQLNSSGIAVINAADLISGTAARIDFNGNAISPLPIIPIKPLPLLGAPKVPVDFGGDPVKDRKEEQVLVDTVLNPAGKYNPLTLPKSIIDSVLGGIPIVGDILSSLSSAIGEVASGVVPDVYDIKYAGSPIESKTSLSAAGKASSTRLVVPPRESAYNQPYDNLIPPQRTSSGEFKYEEESDWSSPEGQKYADKVYSTTAYEHNAIKNPKVEDSVSASGGAGAGSGISAEKATEINNQSAFPLSYKLSEHFTLGMLTLSGKYTVADANLPSAGSSERKLYSKQTLVANLSALCENILEPIYKEIGPCQGGGGGATWLITSGLRTEGAVKTSKASSDHNKGRAVDFQFTENNSVDNLFALITKLEKVLPYNKLIMEYKNNGASRWIHCSYSTEGNAGQTYTYVEDKNTGSGLKKLFS